MVVELVVEQNEGFEVYDIARGQQSDDAIA